MGLRPLEIERFQILVRKVCKNEKNFWKNFEFFAKIGNNNPNFVKIWGAAVSASDVPLLERSFQCWF